MKEALNQLREVHAIQGRDGCWDIDDYMLGMFNGLELALSIVENRECRYKQRPKSQPEQDYPENFIHALAFHTSLSDLEPEHEPVECMCGICKLGHQRKPLTDEEADGVALDVMGFAVLEKEQAETALMLIRATEAAHGIKE